MREKQFLCWGELNTWRVQFYIIIFTTSSFWLSWMDVNFFLVYFWIFTIFWYIFVEVSSLCIFCLVGVDPDPLSSWSLCCYLIIIMIMSIRTKGKTWRWCSSPNDSLSNDMSTVVCRGNMIFRYLMMRTLAYSLSKASGHGVALVSCVGVKVRVMLY